MLAGPRSSEVGLGAASPPRPNPVASRKRPSDAATSDTSQVPHGGPAAGSCRVHEASAEGKELDEERGRPALQPHRAQPHERHVQGVEQPLVVARATRRHRQRRVGAVDGVHVRHARRHFVVEGGGEEEEEL